MTKFATTLSIKNQFTLPVEILKKLGWSSGQKFTIVIKDNSLVIQNYQDILNDISNITANYQLPKISTQEAIKQTHQNGNSTKYKYDN